MRGFVILIFTLMYIMSNANAYVTDINYYNNDSSAIPESIHNIGFIEIDKSYYNYSNITDNEHLIDVLIVPTGIFNITQTKTDNINNTIINLSTYIDLNLNPSIYSGSLIISTGNITKTYQYNIKVSNFDRWIINNETDVIFANTTENINYELLINNSGNTKLIINTSVSGECSNYTHFNRDNILYPYTDNRLVFNLNIPHWKNTKKDICNIILTNVNNPHEVNVKQINISITDNIMPILLSKKINDVMALHDVKFTLDVKDNTGIKNINTTFKYYNTTSYIYNGTTLYRKENTTLESNLMSVDDKGIYYYDFTKTDSIGVYYIDYIITDLNNNSIYGTDIFNVLPMSTIEYNNTIDIGYIKKEFEKSKFILNSKYNIPINITLYDVQIIENNINNTNISNTYIIGIKDFNGDKKYFNSNTKSIIISGNGNIELLISSSTTRRIIGKLKIETVKQHIPINDITFTTQVIDFTPPYQHYENKPFNGVSHECDFIDNGDIYQSMQKCTTIIQYPYFMSEDNIHIIKSIREVEQERNVYNDLINDLKGDIKSINNTLYIVVIFVIFLVFYILYLKKIKPYVFVFGG